MQDSEKILGLNLGADDYLAKPFNPLEAVARVKSNLRRFYSLGSGSESPKQWSVKDLVLDAESCVIKKNGNCFVVDTDRVPDYGAFYEKSGQGVHKAADL